jgi:hypothetical protein
VYAFIENITEAIKGDLGLFNSYIQIIDLNNIKENYRAIELPGMSANTQPMPQLIQQ